MPTVFVHRGYRFFFYAADLDEPPHVHVRATFAPSSGCNPFARRREEDFENMNSTKSNEFSYGVLPQSAPVGKKSKASGSIVKVHIDFEDDCILAPIFIPNLDEVRTFAKHLHAKRQPWQGERFGWQGEYNPSSPESPPGSKMAFTPADFWLGDGAIWFFALLWENGDDNAPVETVYEEKVIGVVA